VNALLYVFVALAGALTSVEAGANAKLEKTAGAPWWPAVAFSLITLVCLLPLALALGGRVPAGAAAKVPWWGWTGGFISAVYIISMLIGPGKLGAGLFTGLTVTAAILASIALDHWGLVGFAVHPAGPGRLIGAALMVAGIICVAVF
jgi:transporter family-2 protein